MKHEWSGQMEANRAQWDKRVPVHVRSRFYDVDSFKSGRNTLRPEEVEGVGTVAGRSLLHLMCHFGMDTLSWARLGASVVGVDFSEPGIEAARALAAEMALDAEFVCANIYDLDLARQFDVVYTAKGVLCWLPDLDGWAAVIARHLRPGGVFYLLDSHPLADVYEEREGRLEIAYPYFPGVAWAETNDRTYTDPDLRLEPMPQFEWTHSVSEIVNSLVGAGLTLEFLGESPIGYSARLPSMTRDAQGNLRIPGDPLPLTLSLRARRA